MHVVNRQTLIDWIYKKLGQGAVRPPITVSQLENSIDESIDYYTFHAGGTGNEEQYAVIPVEHIEVDSNSSEFYTQEQSELECFTPNISAEHFLIYKQEYQLPKSVVAIGQVMPRTCVNNYTSEPILERKIQMTNQGLFATGMPGAYGAYGTAMWTSYAGGPYSTWGGRGGQGTRAQGGGADLVGYELGLQYLEMIKQRYTITMQAQFMEESRRVRFSPPPKASGYIVLPVWARVQDSVLYDNIWIRNYSLALAKIQIAYNSKKYAGNSFPGGANIDGDFYLSEGKEEKDKLEEQILNNTYSFPPNPFFMG